MKSLLALLLMISLSACGDSHDRLMKDQIAYMDRITGVLQKVADGSMSSAEAAGKIKELGKQGDEFMERKARLNRDASPEELQAVVEKYSKESGETLMRYLEALEKLSGSGRLTRELSEAIANMKG